MHDIKELNDNIIAAVKDKLPSGTNIANALMDILFIGREAIYRRLRGEVPFTLSEAAVISSKMNISLDSIVGNGDHGYAIVDLHFSQDIDSLSAYRNMLESQISVYSKLGEDSTSQLQVAYNVLPFMFALKFDHVARFILFKWLYQRGAVPAGTHFSDFALSEELLRLHHEYVEAVWNVSHGSRLLDHKVFEYFISEMRYFYNISVIDDSDMALLKEDLLALMEEMEEVAIRGCFPTGNEVQLYVSSVNFDATYGYALGANTHLTLLKICNVNLITSPDLKLFEQIRIWIESLRKFSTLISQSGEMQRITFFNKQRAALKNI